MKNIAFAAACHFALTFPVHAVIIVGQIGASGTTEESDSEISMSETTESGTKESVKVSAKVAVTPLTYSFDATGEASANNFGNAKALVNCTIDPVGNWGYVSPSLIGFQVNNPYDWDQSKTFVFKEAMTFTGSFVVNGSGRVPSFKAVIGSDKGELTWIRGNGEKNKSWSPIFGYDPLSISKAGETYAESFQGTVAPGTYYIHAGAAWVAYGNDPAPSKGALRFNVTFTPKPAPAAAVGEIRGSVQVIRNGTTTALKVGDTVEVGDAIVTGPKSMVRMNFTDKSLMTLGPNSNVKVEVFKKGSTSLIHLLKGTLRSEIEKGNLDFLLGPKQIIKTSNSTLGIRGTIYEVTYSEANGKASTELEVSEGVVEMIDYHSGEITRVGAGEKSSVTGPIRTPAPTLAPEIAVFDARSKNLASGKDEVRWGALPLDADAAKLDFTLKNIWTADLTGITATIIGEHTSDFVLTSRPPGKLVGGAGSVFSVAFKPSALGRRSAMLQIASNDADEGLFTIDLTGSGIVPGPDIEVMQPAGSNLTNKTSKRSFGSAKKGKPGAAKSFVVKCGGTGNLSKLSASIMGKNPADFEIIGTLPATLKNGRTTTIKVRFKPATQGNRTAKLVIASSDPDENPFEVTLNGLGLK